MKYWINTVSLDHLERGIAGGFTQANHGKATNLNRMRAGDWIIFYSPKTAFQGGEPLQAFTALAEVLDQQSFQVEVSADFRPWRRQVKFHPVQSVPIRDLLAELDFIENKQSWGFKFRFGVFEIGEADYLKIRKALLLPG